MTKEEKIEQLNYNIFLIEMKDHWSQEEYCLIDELRREKRSIENGEG